MYHLDRQHEVADLLGIPSDALTHPPLAEVVHRERWQAAASS